MYESHYTSPNKNQNAMYVTTDPRQFQSARKLNASILENHPNNANSATYFKSLENNYPAIVPSHQQLSMLSHNNINPHHTEKSASPYYWKNEGRMMNHSTMKEAATSKQMLRKKNKTSIENLATWQ